MSKDYVFEGNRKKSKTKTKTKVVDEFKKHKTRVRGSFLMKFDTKTNF